MALGWPTDLDRVSDEWGWRVHPITGIRTMHWGIDFGLRAGAPIMSADDGVVVWAGRNGGEGLSVHVQHAGGILTKYFHASEILVSEGDTVSKGQTLSLVGSTGASTGPHLHFEVWVGGINYNPRSILTGTAVVVAWGYASTNTEEKDDMFEQTDRDLAAATNRGVVDAVLRLYTLEQKLDLALNWIGLCKWALTGNEHSENGLRAMVAKVLDQVDDLDDIQPVLDDIRASLPPTADAPNLGELRIPAAQAAIKA